MAAIPSFVLFLLLAGLLLVVGASAHPDGRAPPRHWEESAGDYHAQMEAHRQRRIRKMRDRLAPKAASLLHHFPRDGAVNALACDKCQIATAIAVDIMMNTTNLNQTQPLVDAACNARFANDTEKKELCELIADVVIDLGHHVFDEIVGHLHFNIPVLVCADIMKLCNEPCCTSATNAPEQVRLSFADGSKAVFSDGNGTLRVTWTSLSNGPQQWQLMWRNASDPTAPWNVPPVMPSAQTSNTGGWQGYVFSQTMSPLAAGATYQYGIFDLASQPANVETPAAGPFNTTTLPADAGTPNARRPLKILALADMGIVNSQQTIQRMTAMVESGDIDFVLHYGDMGYADGDEPVWDEFLRAIEPIASRVPYMTTPGNHECFWNFTFYKMRMQMPPAGDGVPSDAMWYGFDVGSFAFSMMDTESFIDTPQWTPMQAAWLERRLARTNAAQQFSFVAHHRALYCTQIHGDAKDCTKYAAFLREKMEGLYDRMRVPFVTVGHLHNYERTFPVAHDALVSTNYSNAPATVYLVNGAPGNKEGQASFEQDKVRPWSAFRSDAVGFSVMTLSVDADNVGTLASDFVRSSDGVALDSFTLTSDLSALPTQ